MPTNLPEHQEEFLTLMRRARGATIAELQALRGTEAHTCRAVISRLRSVGGFKITRTAEKRGNVYRVATRKAAG